MYISDVDISYDGWGLDEFRKNGFVIGYFWGQTRLILLAKNDHGLSSGELVSLLDKHFSFESRKYDEIHYGRDYTSIDTASVKKYSDHPRNHWNDYTDGQRQAMFDDDPAKVFPYFHSADDFIKDFTKMIAAKAVYVALDRKHS